MEEKSLAQRRAEYRKEYLANGIGDLSDQEKLEKLLFISIPNCDHKQLAENLLENFFTLKGILNASADELMKVDLVTESIAVYLSMWRGVQNKIKRCENASIKVFDSTEKMKRFASNMLSYNVIEKVIMVTMNKKKAILSANVIGSGGTTFSSVLPLEISRQLVKDRPSYVFIAHNHPGGLDEPSYTDVNFTLNFRQWLETFDVKLLDHIIVGDSSVTAMSEGQYGYFFK